MPAVYMSNTLEVGLITDLNQKTNMTSSNQLATFWNRKAEDWIRFSFVV